MPNGSVKFVGKKTKKSSRFQRIPRISQRDTNTIRLEKANMDVRPTLLTTYFQGQGPYAPVQATAAKDFAHSSCPLYNLVNSGLNWQQLYTGFTEYRVVKATLHLMLYTSNVGYVATQTEASLADQFVLGTANANTTYDYIARSLVLFTAWQRGGTYGQPAVTTSKAIATLPQCKQWVWNIQNIQSPEFWTQITADGGGEHDWLCTCDGASPIVPSSAPNTGKYFNPIFNVVVTVTNAPSQPTNNVSWAVEEELVVECRGSKL